ncbi:LOG family protein [Micrococcoides hystricis]|uniref:LOG family protein n=1 Tax=Micrococcoides hystricis TaxID=1572761 RepID=A0ABV6P9U9_9MICC
MVRPVHRAQHIQHVESLSEFETLLDRLLDDKLAGVHILKVDLREKAPELDALDPRGALFAECQLPAGYDESLRAAGALVFPKLPAFPFDPYRSQLYTAEELFEGIHDREYEHVPDTQIYAWSTEDHPESANAALAVSLHDHAINIALERAHPENRRLVGVMGGHSSVRGSENYAFAAELGHLLANAGFTVATGGGPGSMEAANLGAYLYRLSPEELRAALSDFSGEFDNPTLWARNAMRLRQAYPQSGENRSLGIPTWAYGHEPPNVFANTIAKYFTNAIREAILLEKCGGGIVFLPGAAGTIQEIFQDACENYYAPTSKLAPMILVGSEYWRQRYPVWQLLTALAKDTPMEDYVHLVDDAESALSLVRRHQRRSSRALERDARS